MFGLHLVSTALAALPPFTPIPEGDFESGGDLTGWTVVGSDVYEDDSAILDNRILVIDRGSGAARACSPQFVLTRTDVSALMKDLFTTGPNARSDLWVEDPARVTLATVDLETLESSTMYRREFLDVTAACGETVRVCVEPGTNDAVGYDEFRMEGPACEEFVDGDGDGVCPVGHDSDGNGTCLSPGEFDAGLFDCDDGDPLRSPLVVEVCDGVVDEDCDGLVDNGFDEDDDGWTTCQDDCEDGNPAVNPGMYDDCNLVDDNCDDVIDEGHDQDNDGFSWCDGDCDNGDPNQFPGASEQCNGEDDDCNGIDDDDVKVSSWWPDDDGDGFGDEDASPVEDCAAPPDTVGNDGDCDDTDADVNPTEGDPTVDGIDQDCDGQDGNDGTVVDDTGDTETDTDTDTDPDTVDRAPSLDEGPEVAIQAGCGCGGAGSGGLAAAIVLAAVTMGRRRR